MNFSFFRDIRGGPGEIRARQISEYLKGRINPESDYENDICIYILGCYSRENPEPKHSYYDVIDCGLARLSRIRKFTKGNIIAVSSLQYQTLKEYFADRKIYLIPQHHCNFNRELRPERDVKVVGCIGGDSAVQWPHYAVERLLNDAGLEWKFGHHYSKRQQVVDFYKTIDIQLSFRPTHPRGLINHMNALKLANAGSFGIPTISYPEPAYTNEWPDEAIYSDSLYELIRQAKKLSNNIEQYKEMSEKALKKAESYYIDNISKLYLDLKDVVII